MPALKRSFAAFCSVLFLFFALSTSAMSYFSEDFTGSSLDTNVWQEYSNSGTISVNSGKLTLLRSTNKSSSFPYIFNKIDIFPNSGSFSLKMKYRYLSTGNFGDAITISPDSAPENGTNPDSNLPTFMTFMIYQDAPNGLSFGKILCDQNGMNCNTRTFLRPFTHSSDLNEHLLRIDYTNEGRYIIFLDGNDDPEFTSDINQKRPKKVWFGNSLVTGSNDFWSSMEIDSIAIEPLVSKNSVVVIPGFGGSWDIGAILTGTSGNNWIIPPFIKNYEGIIQSFKNAGYEEGIDLFVFPYDWRKPLDGLAEDLNNFINSKNVPGKIDLVGHSMGGLVARAYGQKYGVSNIGKILTAGTPHMGTIDMYGLWEGAKIWDGVWWEDVLLEVASEVNRLPGETEVASIRRVSPSIIDLFPTFPFLNMSGSPVGIDMMINRNTYLKNLNQNASAIEDKLIPFWSEDVNSTKSIINVQPRNNQEASEGKWEDGSPVGVDPFEKTLGDGTVTKVSAVGPFGAGEKLTGWHSDLVSSKENIAKIFQELGLDDTLAVSSETDSRKNSFAAILRSPGIIEVCNRLQTKCDNQLGLYFPEFKLFILPGYTGEDLVVRVKESGLGKYKLHLGIIDDSPDWNVQDGELKNSGQIDFYGVSDSGGNTTSFLDNIPPVVTIASPSAKFYRTTNLPKLTYSVSDNWDTSPIATGSGWADTEGVHTATVSATDVAGNTGQGTVTYTVDNTPPEIKISSPEPTTYFSDNLPKISYVVKDNLDPSPKIEISGWSVSTGAHTVTIRSTDGAGNTSLKSVTYRIENKPTNKDQCKKNGWNLFKYFGFKNQGYCESFFDQHKNWHWKRFWDFWRGFRR